MMRTQMDTKVRVVTLDNLEAMCAHVSGGMCHKYQVAKATATRVQVEYSNEDEYANSHPMYAEFPCYKGVEADNPNVVLEYVRIIHDNADGEGWQNFEQLRDCPSLWRDPVTGEWKTREEIESRVG